MFTIVKTESMTFIIRHVPMFTPKPESLSIRWLTSVNVVPEYETSSERWTRMPLPSMSSSVQFRTSPFEST
jgi:hypothetical protein